MNSHKQEVAGSRPAAPTLKGTPTATHWGVYEVTSEDGRITAIEAPAADPDPSPIGPGMVAALDHPTRIQRPAVRRGWLEAGPGADGRGRGAEPFVEVSWERALDLAAEAHAAVAERHGNRSIYGGSYGWASAGRFHHAQSQLKRFLAMSGGFTDSVGTYSFGALQVILPHVIGGTGPSAMARSPRWSEIAEHCELVVAIGGLPTKNVQVTLGGVGRHTTRSWMSRCAEAGVEFVNVGPIRDDTDEPLGARWLPLRPNTDVALMLGMAHTMISEGLHDLEYLETRCVGFEQLRRYVVGEADGVQRDAAWAAEITELEPEMISALAHELASKRSLLTVSWSVQRADHGEQVHWMGVALAAMAGSMREPGCGFGAGFGSEHSVGEARPGLRVAALERPANCIHDVIPVARITDALLNPGETIDFNGGRITYPDLRLIYWAGGNPFHHHQDLNRLVEAWQRPETVIVNDSWWNPMARFADIVFPVATALERNDLAAGLGDRWLCALQRAAEPPGDARTDYEIFAGLAQRLGFAERFTEDRSADEWVAHLYEQTRQAWEASGAKLPSFEEFLALGRVQIPAAEEPPPEDLLSFSRDPESNPLSTPSGKIEIFSARVEGFGYDDCPGHPAWMAPAEWLGSELAGRFPLHLISNQPRTRLHSQYDIGSYSVDSKVAGREPIRLSPADAKLRGVRDGDIVRVFNDRGECLAGAQISDELRPGVVQLSTGAWYDPERPGEPGGLERHGNPNVLTRDAGTSRLAQGPSALTTLVDVERFEAEVPPVRAFDPPALVSEAGS